MYKSESVVTHTPKALSQPPKGHEAYLKSLEQSKASIIIEYLDGAEKDVGVIKTSDKFTISIRIAGGPDIVVYKHAIRRFYAIPRASV